jgi:DNA-binding transcriptional ArsR family regulator
MVHYSARGLDAVFNALGDPTRRAVLASLRDGERSVGGLAEPFGMSLTGFIKHLGVLEDAGLIERRKSGRVVSCRLTSSGMKGALEWLRTYEEFWNTRLDRLGKHLERKEQQRWNSQSTREPASRSGGSSTPRSPSSTPRGRTRRK